MNGKIPLIGLVAVLLLLPAIPYAMAAGTITIEANSKYYKPGDSVTLSGSTSLGANKEVYVSVNDTQGVVFQTTATTDSSGKYQAGFTLDKSAYIGVYRAKANDASNKALTYFTVSNITPTDLAQNLIKLAQDAQARTEKLFQQLKSQNVTLFPAATKAHDNGVEKLTNATTLLGEGHPWEALAATRASMIWFRDAIRDAWASAKVDRVADKTAEVLNATIQRGLETTKKLNDTIIKLAAGGNDVTAAKSDLADAKTQLTSAASLLKDNKLADTEKAVDVAKADLQKVIQDLKPLVTTVAHENILKFLNSAEARADNLETQLKNLRNENNKGRVDAAIARLEVAKTKLSQAIASLNGGNDAAALKSLQAANNDIMNGIGNVDTSKISTNLRNINMLKAKIQYLERTKEQMQKWGMDTKAVQSQIDALQTQLTQAQTNTP